MIKRYNPSAIRLTRCKRKEHDIKNENKRHVSSWFVNIKELRKYVIFVASPGLS